MLPAPTPRLDAPSLIALCRQLLANHVIEDFHFELEQERKRR
jgi:phosphoribosylformylglycinamidine (FGAM) synthase PurS component